MDRKSYLQWYQVLHRFATGITVLCFIVTVVGGAVVGARVNTILFRSALVLLILIPFWRILIRTWASWEELRGGGIKRDERTESAR